MGLGRALADVLPPGATDFLLRLKAGFKRPEWEAVGQDEGAWDRLAGWSHASIAAEQRRKWPRFVATLAGAQPLGRAHEGKLDGPVDLGQHNTIMSFAYGLARAASERRSLSVLDWGGGVGHYYALARALRPDLALDYWIKDVPELCAAGRELNPGCRFVEDEAAALGRHYDFVFASCSIHYSRDVYAALRQLCAAVERWLMVTRLPVVERADDFIVVQRPHNYGYLTEYPGWFVNRARFLDCIVAQGLHIEREFVVDEKPVVLRAPEHCCYKGFLFERRDARG